MPQAKACACSAPNISRAHKISAVHRRTKPKGAISARRGTPPRMKKYGPRRFLWHDAWPDNPLADRRVAGDGTVLTPATFAGYDDLSRGAKHADNARRECNGQRNLPGCVYVPRITPGRISIPAAARFSKLGLMRRIGHSLAQISIREELFRQR